MSSFRDEDLAIGHRHIVAVVGVVLQELAAPQAVSCRVAIVLAVDRGDAEAPVDVILLHGVGQALEIDDGLIERDGVGIVEIRCRPVAAANRFVRDVAAHVDPAVDLEVVVVHRLAERGVAQRIHERAVDRARPRHAEGVAAP